jgi:arylsulfatase
MRPYLGQWEEKAFGGNHYRAHPTPRAAYAGMVSRMDRDIGRLMAVLRERGMEGNTLVIFASDNGPTYAGGADAAFFDSTGGLRGLKGSLYEGGIRVPLIARWPARVKAGTISDHVCAFWDLMPTLAELAGADVPAGIDGLSFLRALTGMAGQKRHGHLYWEHFARQGSQAVRMGDWKGVRVNVRRNRSAPMQLFNLRSDRAEQRDLAGERPDIVEMMARLMSTSRVESDIWPLLR